MSAADGADALKSAEVRSLFADLADHPILILAVSGGPDSTALLVLAARWRKARKRGPRLVAVTVDHGLRPGARREALAVKRLARSLGVAHRTLRWTGRKPSTGLQEAARNARYRLLAGAARGVKARHILTAHTLDDQAETVLFRLLRGSGLAGLSGMTRQAVMPSVGAKDLWLIRPLLDVPKSRLIATAKAEGADFSDDPSNRDPRFARPRLRALAPALAAEGLTANRLALLAKRVLRAEHALMQALVEAQGRLAPEPWPEQGPVAIPAVEFSRLPQEIALRLLGWVVNRIGNEGPVELGKLEALHGALAASSGSVRFRRTLAGAVVTRSGERLVIERAPARRTRAASNRP